MDTAPQVAQLGMTTSLVYLGHGEVIHVVVYSMRIIRVGRMRGIHGIGVHVVDPHHGSSMIWKQIPTAM